MKLFFLEIDWKCLGAYSFSSILLESKVVEVGNGALDDVQY